MQSLAGTMWRLVEASAVDDRGREVPSPLGRHPMGFVIFGEDRMLGAIAEEPPPLGAPVRVLISYTGPYRFNGTELVTDAEAASRPELVTEQVRIVRFDGPTRMVLSSKNDVLGGGQALALSIAWEQVQT